MLKKIFFPVGDYTKEEIRKLAKKFKLPVIDIPESQEICFIQTTINDFLIKHLKLKPGKIVDVKGKIIGQHQGLWFYTIGQRKGIKLFGGPAFAKATAGKPFYVLDKDLKKNLLIVTKNEKDLYKKELIAENINWISGKIPKLPLRVKAKIRYRHDPALAMIRKQKDGKIRVVFTKSQRAITSGQSIVFYLPAGRHGLLRPAKSGTGKSQELLGGGIII